MKPILAHLGLVTVGDEQAFAVTSPDNRYRYVLGRIWDPHLPLWVYGMLNPSKARGAVVVDGKRKVVDDPTIRKCSGFAFRGGAGGFLVVNALAYSATDPQDMVRAHSAGTDVVGEHNATALAWVTRPATSWALAPSQWSPNRYIAAWGKVPPRLKLIASPAMTQFACCAPDCFGLNGDKSPKHPLMLGYATPIVRFVGSGGVTHA